MKIRMDDRTLQPALDDFLHRKRDGDVDLLLDSLLVVPPDKSSRDRVGRINAREEKGNVGAGLVGVELVVELTVFSNDLMQDNNVSKQRMTTSTRG